MEKIISIMFLFITSTAFSSEELKIKFIPDCFFSNELVQFQGIAINPKNKSTKYFIYLQCKGKDMKSCAYNFIRIYNDVVGPASVSHLSFSASHVSDSSSSWKMSWDRDQGDGDIFYFDFDKKAGLFKITEIFKRSPKNIEDNYILSCK